MWIFTGSRSERGLLEPILRRARQTEDLDARLMPIDPRASMEEIMYEVQTSIFAERPDIAVVSCDRREMVPVAMCLFYNDVLTVHYLGGVFTFSGTHDDVGRHVISLFSHILCVESKEAKDILVKAGEAPWRVHVTGTSHFDDLEIDESLVPWKRDETLTEYDLILVNPEADPVANVEIAKRLRGFYRFYSVMIRPNEDPLADQLWSEVDRYVRGSYPVAAYDDVTRPQFLGLLKNCRRFISNSSATLYEAPYFGVPVVNPSIRNSERTPPDPKLLKGGSDRVVDILRTLDLDDPSLLRKRVRDYR